MIYCPRCGTANREGSRFCNDCGQKLGTHTRIKCPHCGSMNSVQNVFCDECGGRLLPTPEAPAGEPGPTIKGLSLPTKAPAPEEAQDEGEAPEPGGDAPAWLRALGDSWSAGPRAETPAGEEGDEIPDWLQDLRASLPEQDTSEAQGADGEVPEWLDDMRNQGEEPEVEPDASTPDDGEEEQVGGWLDEFEPLEEEDQMPDQEDEAGELPGWLAGLDLSGNEDEEESPLAEGEAEETTADKIDEPAKDQDEAEIRTAEAEGAERPVWLTALDLTGQGEKGETQSEAGDELPAGTDEPEMAEDEVELPAVGGEGAGSPEWLTALDLSGEAVPSDPGGEAGQEGEEDEVDDEDPPAELLESEGMEEDPALPLAEGDDIEAPEWLAALGLVGAQVEEAPPEEETLEEEAPAEESAAEAPADELGMPEAELPDWLDALRPPETEAEVLSGEDMAAAGEVPDWLVLSDEEMEEGQGLARADIPAWLLALKPIELRQEEETVEEEAPEVEELPEEGGLLAGLTGTLPVEMLVAQPRAVTSPAIGELPTSDTPQARLFAEIVRRPPESAPKPMQQPQAVLISRLPLWIIYLALIAVVTVPLLIGEPLLVRPADPSAAVESLYQSVESLEAGSPVLVAFDYDPTTSGEMDVLARTVVGHLMDRGAGVVAVSLLPAGPATAEMVLDGAAQGRPGYAEDPGQFYANLGYLPGQVAAVRLLGQSVERALPRDFRATPLAELEAAARVTDIESFALIVELAATQETLRWWVEQAGTPYEVPLSAAVSASVEPIARAYYETESRQLEGLIAGVPGAAEYDALVNNQDVLEGPVAMRLDAQLAGHLVFILVLVVGAVVQSTRRKAGRGQ